MIDLLGLPSKHMQVLQVDQDTSTLIVEAVEQPRQAP